MKCTTCKAPITTKPEPLWHGQKVCNRCYQRFNHDQKLLNYAIRKGTATFNIKSGKSGWWVKNGKKHQKN